MSFDIKDALKTEIVNIGEILCDENKNELVIPNFQRDYSWKEEQVEQLLNDIIESYENSKTNGNEFYFLSTIQFANLDSNENELSIIDGQQRLITLILIIKVLNEKIHDNSNQKQFVNIKINNNETNQHYYSEVIKNNDLNNSNDSNLYLKNYIYIKNYLEKQDDNKNNDKFEIELLNYIIKNVIVMKIVSNNKDVPLSKVLKIFDSLNTKGMDLNAGDIFKIQFAEYLYKENRNKNIEDILHDINSCYEEIAKLNDEIENGKYKYENKWSMDDVLLIYQHIIIASDEKLELEWIKKGREKFFEDIFKKDRLDILSFDNLIILKEL